MTEEQLSKAQRAREELKRLKRELTSASLWHPSDCGWHHADPCDPWGSLPPVKVETARIIKTLIVCDLERQVEAKRIELSEL